MKGSLQSNMELRNGKRLPLAQPTRPHRHQPRPFRLLDLPTELRLMIYGYVFGHQDVHWMMTYQYAPDSGFIRIG